MSDRIGVATEKEGAMDFESIRVDAKQAARDWLQACQFANDTPQMADDLANILLELVYSYREETDCVEQQNWN
jgi:hypothetical protein